MKTTNEEFTLVGQAEFDWVDFEPKTSTQKLIADLASLTLTNMNEWKVTRPLSKTGKSRLILVVNKKLNFKEVGYTLEDVALHSLKQIIPDLKYGNWVSK